jgi:hypothetical protein
MYASLLVVEQQRPNIIFIMSNDPAYQATILETFVKA